jgi:hypothetical protein
MNVNKHMEVIFVTTLAVAGAGSFLADRWKEAKADPAVPAARNIGTPGHPAVVIVRATREARRA